MNTISVIQLGDVHFPGAKTQVVGDVKDKAISEGFRNALAPKKLKLVFNELDRVKKQNQPCGLLICGDLTTNGDLAQYAECVAYITQNATLNGALALPRDHWHVVPGNHDVDRKCLAPNAAPFPALFHPLAGEWKKEFEPSALTFDNLRVSRIQHTKCILQLFSINTCVGCGEWRQIPEKLRNSLAKQVEDLLSMEFDAARAFGTVAEQLDAPAFLESHVGALCAQIKLLEAKALPLILGHHNLLPQATPRLEVYTELLNSGMLRTRLTSIGRPVIYCHGHIHDDPIEIVTCPSDAVSNVVVVSAPEAVDGFNLLKVSFGKTYSPIGLEVVRYRLKNNGDVFAESPIRISLCPRIRSLTQLDSEVRSAFDACGESFESLYVVRNRFKSNTGREPQFESLRNLLIEAEWFGLVELANRADNDARELRVQRIVP